MKKSILVTMLLAIFQSAMAFAQPAGIAGGINYLLSTQSNEGSWNGSAITVTLSGGAAVHYDESLLN